MGLSSLFRLPKLPSGLLIVPLLALALAGPAGAETKAKPQNSPANGTPSAQAKSATPAPKLKLDTDINQPAASQGATQSGTSQGTGQTVTNTAQPGAKGAGEGAAQSGTNTAQPEAKSAEPDKKATQPVEDGTQANPSGKQILVNIDKSTQEMTVFVDGLEQYNWKVSTGRPEYATPSGTYTPTSMNEMWYSKQWDNSPMPHAVFFMKDGHAIHGTHEVKNLGKPASHGCVRLAPENATILYDLVKENGLQNTQVVLSGETPGGEYKGGVASARPQYQYPQYPYGYGYGRGQAVAPPWYNPGQEAQIQPNQQPQPRRRGLFRWFQQNQGYYAPPPAPRYYQRGYGY
jgi:lipoprotein-anchoring transpeptidase ErfK/SrfK